MQAHWSFHHVTRNPQIENAIHSYTRKLEKLLGRFSPDLIHLHGVLEYSAAHQGPVCSLNLWLPTGQLHSREEGGTDLAILKSCFDQLIEQIKKHKEVLRRESVWKRRRYKFRQEFQEMQAGEIRITNRQQLREYLDQVLPQLVRFIARELRWREAAGLLPPGYPSQEEIVNEIVVRALDHCEKKASETDPPFHCLIREAISVLDGSMENAAARLSGSAEETTAIGIGSSSDVLAGKIGAARLWQRNRLSATKEANLPETQLPDPADLFLANLPILDRQVYVLRALEGFDEEEAAKVLGKTGPEVEQIFSRVSREVAAALDQKRAAGWSPRASDEIPPGAAAGSLHQ
ncbi:MAG: hypothetical protein HY313_02615 [Acidobacteria bacterium]|nr:hypothetical protein [Acidobacteriota bacterium]